MTQINKNQIKLPGGTTGQVIAKASDDDFDFDWVSVSGILTGNANLITYFDDEGNLTTDSLFSRDSVTKITNIGAVLDTSNEPTVNFGIGEAEIFSTVFFPGIGQTMVDPITGVNGVFGLFDGTPVSAPTVLYAQNLSDGANTTSTLSFPGFWFSAVDDETLEYRVQIDLGGNASFSYTDNLESPTESFSIGILGNKIAIVDQVNTTAWFLPIVPGTEGQVLTMGVDDQVTFQTPAINQILVGSLVDAGTVSLDTLGSASSYIIKPDGTIGGTISTGTIELPTAPNDGDIITIIITGTVTTLTIDPGIISVVGTLPTSSTVNEVLKLVYSNVESAWFII